MSIGNNVPLGTPLSAVEVKLTYGGDYEISPTGDLVTVRDTPYSPDATIQRVTFGILTNPAIQNVLGTNIAEPDDMFNPSYGSGARAYIGRNNTATNLDAIQRNIYAILAADPYIASSPAPSVTITTQNDAYQSQVYVTITFTTVTGQIVTIPDLLISGATTV